MSRAVVYSLLPTTVLLLFILFSRTAHDSPNRNLRLGRRDGGFKHAPFDPRVSGMELSAEPAESGSTLAAPVSGDANNHLTEQGRLNVTLRLMILFPFLDINPSDGVVSREELEAWNVRQAMGRLEYQTRKELAALDKDGDGEITLKEYLPQVSDEEFERNGMEHGEPGWWREQFYNADLDSNGSLGYDEFKDFLHPEDSKNERIQEWLLREKMKRMENGDDDDGKLDFVEFDEGAYHTYKSFFEFESPGGRVPSSEEKFAELDLNNDKFLTVEELRPIFHYLYPGEKSYAKYYTKYLIHEADDNGDGTLTIDEMLNHEYIFYSTVFEDESTEDGHSNFHDEF